MRLPYKKMSGAGNDFIVVDDRAGTLPRPYAALARRVCDRRTPWGGADGFIVVRTSPRAQFAMDYFNADGSTGAMCGNGGRCAAGFAIQAGYAEGPHVTFTTMETRYTADVEGDHVRLLLPPPRTIDLNRFVTVFDRSLRCHYVDVETPHAIVFLDDLGDLRPAALDALDLARWGPAMRHHPAFAPEGANANFAEVRGSDCVALRTWERGVEGETLACGTGAVSTALAAHFARGVAHPVNILTRSGETLRVEFTVVRGNVTGLSLEGSARVEGEGTLEV